MLSGLGFNFGLGGSEDSGSMYILKLLYCYYIMYIHNVSITHFHAVLVIYETGNPAFLFSKYAGTFEVFPLCPHKLYIIHFKSLLRVLSKTTLKT